MNSVDLRNEAKNIGIELTDDMLAQLETYCALLQQTNEKVNLTAITETEEIYEKHFYDSMLPLPYIKEGKLIDVGSGAGFPGLVMAIVRKDLDVTLLEANNKKCNFLNEVKNKLKLENVIVVNDRADDFIKEEREKYDYVIARAVANLNILSELCIPFIKVDEVFIAMKGSKGSEEEKEALHAIETLGCELDFKQEIKLRNDDERINLFYKKKESTDKKYPRSYNAIKNKPLK